MIDVACVGILVADVIVKPVEGMPEKGLLSLVDSIELFSGGNAMTASVNLSKMGFRSAVVGKIGKDPLGQFLKSRLLEYNVNCESLREDAEVQTSASIALSSKDGERTFFHCIGANGAFCIDDVDWGVIEKSQIVFVTGTFLLNTFDGEQTAFFLKKCKAMGKITALDVCWDSSGRWGQILEKSMRYIDYFLPSIDEAKMIAQKDGLDEMADVFFAKGVQKVVIKLGKNGCYLKESKDAEPVTLPAYQNITAVDTTGAGDSFCSGFLAGLRKKMSFCDCARFANAVGAHCVMARGATTGIKSYPEIFKFMEENQ